MQQSSWKALNLHTPVASLQQTELTHAMPLISPWPLSSMRGRRQSCVYGKEPTQARISFAHFASRLAKRSLQPARVSTPSDYILRQLPCGLCVRDQLQDCRGLRRVRSAEAPHHRRRWDTRFSHRRASRSVSQETAIKESRPRLRQYFSSLMSGW